MALPSNRFSDLVAGVPGSYVIEKASYKSKYDFERDLARARELSGKMAWHFSTVDDPRLKLCLAFFVFIVPE